jgi:putative transposase
MTVPRCILSNRTYLITRRCSERRYFLRPESKIVCIFEYLLGLACERHGILLHGYVCMSNHYHLVVTDPDGALPDFLQFFNSLLARAVNCARGRWESFWSRDSYNAVELLEDADILDKLVYTLVNPVNAGLVGRARDWEGASSISLRFGGRRIVPRPSIFFSERMPEHVSLELRVPHSLGHVRGHELHDELAKRIGVVEAKFKALASKPLGMHGVLALDWKDSPTTTVPRRGRNPRLAAKCTTVRVAAIAAYKCWVEAYRSALARFVAGDRKVEWPRGTYWMCARLGCPRAA